MKFSELTEQLAQEEGLKEQISIAQIKEVTRLLLTKLANMPLMDFVQLLSKYQKGQ